MNPENTFKTKTGFCHVEKDQIILTKDGVIENSSKDQTKNKIVRTLIFYALLSFYFLYSAFENYKKGETVFMSFSIFFAFILLVGIIKSWNNSSTSLIERNRIKKVQFIAAKKGLTRAVFEILFEDNNGKIKKRLIMLPGSLSNGQIETQKAVDIMKKEGII